MIGRPPASLEISSGVPTRLLIQSKTMTAAAPRKSPMSPASSASRPGWGSKGAVGVVAGTSTLMAPDLRSASVSSWLARVR